MEGWKPQSHHRGVETTESPWEGGNHRVTTGGWKQRSHHRRVETTESTQEGGNHRVTMGESKP